MYRTGKNTYHIEPDEQLVSNFMEYLMEERGQTFEEAEATLMGLPDVVARVLNGNLVAFIKDEELPIEPEPGQVPPEEYPEMQPGDDYYTTARDE